MVLVGELGNMTLTLESSNPFTTKCLDPSDKVVDYQRVLGFAIEADGTVGSLEIPGGGGIIHSSGHLYTPSSSRLEQTLEIHHEKMFTNCTRPHQFSPSKFAYSLSVI